MNKKGIAIHWLALILGFFVAFGTITYQSSTSVKLLGENIGGFQLSLLKNFQKGDDVLFYIDQSAKYSLQQSVYELAQDGASVSDFDINELTISQPFIKNSCGKFKDAYIWYELTKDDSGNYVKSQCLDSASDFLKVNLVHIFDNNLNQYLKNSPYGIPAGNYNYEVKDSLEIIGKAKLPLQFDILKDETKPAIKKAVKTKIEQKISEDFTESAEEGLCAKGVKCILTEEAYQLLIKAQNIAKGKQKKLVVNSAYRSQEAQKLIWDNFAVTYPNVEERRKKVCNPINNNICPHTTGNAVDVVFDGKTTKTMTNADWKSLDEIMSQAGWVRYGAEKRFNIGEPWHFECCGTIRYAKAKELEKKTGQPVTAIV